MDMISTIVVYKFTHLTRQEVETMLGTRLQETRVYRDAKQEGIEQGIEQEREEGIERQRSLIFRLLTRQVGKLSKPQKSSIDRLSLDQLENLNEALLDFATIADLETWLATNA
jgi:predicted transposase YdaD